MNRPRTRRKAGKYQPFITPAQAADMVRRYLTGEPVADIAKTHDVTVPGVLYHVKAAAVPMRGRDWRSRRTA